MTSELRPAVEVWREAFETWAGEPEHDNAPEAAAAVIEADREAVRAEMRQALIATGDAAATHLKELAKFKALAETLAGALEAAAYALHTISESNPDCMGWEPPYPSTVSTVSVEAKAATETLHQYKEARDV